jgi:hypothetical protein
MTEEIPPDDETPLLGRLAGQFTLVLIITIIMGGGLTMAARVLPPLAGLDMGHKVSGPSEAIAILVVACILIVLLTYLSVIVWMLVARLFLPRATIYAIMTSGPTWRFDHWLFNLICPDDKPR